MHKLRNGFIRNLTDGRKRFCGGKEILVKVIAQEIPTYVMSVFRLLKQICSGLEQIIRGFWWGHMEHWW